MSNCVSQDHFKLFLHEYWSSRDEQLNEYKTSQKEQSDTLAKLIKLMNRQADHSDYLKAKLLLSERRILELEGRINHLEIIQQQSKLTVSQSNNSLNDSFSQKVEKYTPKVVEFTPDDPCEILFSGISPSITLSPMKLINQLLFFVGLSCAVNHVFSIRSWKDKHQKSTPTRAFVVKFSSSLVRNEVLRIMKSYKSLNSHNIFGATGHSTIKVINLLPKSTYLLLLKTRKLCKTLNYDPPIVKNATIYMRKTRQSPVIPITSKNDLNHFSSK